MEHTNISIFKSLFFSFREIVKSNSNKNNYSHFINLEAIAQNCNVHSRNLIKLCVKQNMIL